MTTDDDKYRVNYKGIDYLFNHPRGWEVLESAQVLREPRRWYRGIDYLFMRHWARYVVWGLGDRWFPLSAIYGYRRTRRGAERLARRVMLHREWWRKKVEAESGHSWPFRFVYVTNLDDRDDAQRARMLARGPVVGPLSITEADPSLPHSLPQRPKTGILSSDPEEVRRALS